MTYTVLFKNIFFDNYWLITSPNCIAHIVWNIRQGNCPCWVGKIIIGNIISDKEVQDWAGYEKYDIVVANILHNVLDVLTPVILRQLKPGGIYITSGIIDEKEGFMLDVMKRDGLEVLDVTRQGEWVSITARKPE